MLVCQERDDGMTFLNSSYISLHSLLEGDWDA